LSFKNSKGAKKMMIPSRTSVLSPRKTALACGVAISALMAAHAAAAQSRAFDVPSQEAVKTIPEFARQAGVQIVAPASQLRGVRTPAVRGEFEVAEALDTLLTGTGLEVAGNEGGVIMLRNPSLPARLQLAQATVAAAPVAAAQRPAEERQQIAQAGAIEEIVVTSRRREESLQDIPMSVAAFTDTALEQRNITRIDQLQYQVPSLIMTESERVNQSRIVIRGIGGGNPRPAVPIGTALYVDGVYVPFSIGAYSSTLEIERVEVLRGPQGTLFGKNTTGGLVNIITKRPSPDAEGRVEVGLDSFNGLDVKLAVNQPIVEDKLFLRVGMAYHTDDGYYEDLNTGTGYSDQETRAGQATLRWLPNDQWTIDITGAYSHEPRHGNGGTCKYLGATPNNKAADAGVSNPSQILQTACNATAAAGDYKFYTQEKGFATTNVSQVVGRALWEAPSTILGMENFSAQMTTAYRYITNHYYQDIDFTIADYNARSSYVPNGMGLTMNSKTAELLLNGDALDSRLDVTAGAYYFNDKAGVGGTDCHALYQSVAGTGQSIICANSGGTWFDFNSTNPGAPRPGQMSRTNEFTDNWTFATFTHLAYNITEKLKLDAGIRYTWDHRSERDIYWDQTKTTQGYVDILNDNTVTVNVGIGNTWEASTPMVGLTYSLDPMGALDSGIIYSTVSTGFLSGGFNSEGGSEILAIAPTFGPEHVTAYELGVKTNWLDGRAQVNLAVFRTDYKDKQEQIAIDNSDGRFPGDPTLNIVQNVARSRITGFEWETTFNPVSTLVVDFSGSYLKNRYQEFTALAFDPTIVQFLQNMDTIVGDLTPPWKGNIGARYMFDMGDNGSITPRVSMYFQNAYRTNSTTPVANRPINPITGLEGSCYRGGYEKWDARLAWENADRDVSVALWATNLLDEKIIRACVNGVNAVSNAPAGNGIYTNVLEPPQRFGVTASLRW